MPKAAFDCAEPNSVCSLCVRMPAFSIFIHKKNATRSKDNNINPFNWLSRNGAHFNEISRLWRCLASNPSKKSYARSFGLPACSTFDRQQELKEIELVRKIKHWDAIGK